MSIIISNIKLELDRPDSDAFKKIQKQYGINCEMQIYRKSIDARKGNILKVISVCFNTENDDKFLKKYQSPHIRKRTFTPLNPISGKKTLPHTPFIVGFGPAGIMCAYLLARHGYKPVIFEMGEAIDERDISVNDFFLNQKLNINSNIQFGEGGAGSYSDGKLTTRINDPLCDEIISILHKFGAPDEILHLAKPHIGTDILKEVVKNIRNEIIRLGGEVRFNSKLNSVNTSNGKLTSLTVNGETYPAELLVLAIGHSSRDTFEMLYENKVFIEPKAFAVGARIEHLQSDIDHSLYKFKHKELPIGEYNFSQTVDNRPCYTFCMCPGGYVVPSSSEENAIVTNGMSYHARDGINANSALVVGVSSKDFGEKPLDGMYFQRNIERKAYSLTNSYKAPCAVVSDFLQDKKSTKFNSVKPTYEIGTEFQNFNGFLPQNIVDAMKLGLANFSSKNSAFVIGDAVLTGPETRTSSPIRITRNDKLHSINTEGLIPCGEGAGYAGGIVSAMVDGLKCAIKIIEEYKGF